jgi:hypothetical protein
LLARWFLPQTGPALWRKQAIIDVGKWKVDQPCCQEHELYLRLLMAGKRFAYGEHNGAIYRHWGETSLWRANVPKVHRQRLEIEQSLENFLREQGKLTVERLQAINQARFETARSIWQYDPVFATEVMAAVRQLQPDFVPGGDASPPRYRVIYRTLGFRAAEKIAAARRTLVDSRMHL